MFCGENTNKGLPWMRHARGRHHKPQAIGDYSNRPQTFRPAHASTVLSTQARLQTSWCVHSPSANEHAADIRTQRRRRRRCDLTSAHLRRARWMFMHRTIAATGCDDETRRPSNGRGGCLCIRRPRRQEVMVRLRTGALRQGVVDVYASDDRGGRK